MLETASLSTIPPLSLPCVLTIGAFDGIHLGHQALIRHARILAGPRGSLVLLTFSPHPQEFFSPYTTLPKLCSPQQKLALLEKNGIDLVITLKFTAEIASLSPETFVRLLKEKLPFSHLVFGSGALIGKDRQGDETLLKTLQQPFDFQAHYLTKSMHDTDIISSGRIRKHIQENDLLSAAALLGRPYSLALTVTENCQASAAGLCLPPAGIYPVTIRTPTASRQESLFITRHLLLPHTPPGRVEIVF